MKSKSASRSLPNEEYKQLAHLRILCLSEEDRAVHPLELQEDFVEICRTDECVEIRDKSEIEVRFSGNLVCLNEEEFIMLKSATTTTHGGSEHVGGDSNTTPGNIPDDLFSSVGLRFQAHQLQNAQLFYRFLASLEFGYGKKKYTQ